jgi:hypothetical protein
MKIEVFSPNVPDDDDDESNRPFFSAISKPSSWLPSFPFSTSWSIQDLSLAQPPIQPPTETQMKLIKDENPATLTGGEQEWTTILPEMKGRMRVCYYEPGLEGKEFGDGIGFPKIKPWKLGLEWLPGMKLVFPESKKLLSKGKDDNKTK